MKKVDTKKLVGVALFTAIVVVLQLIGSGIKLGPFSISLVLVPIVIGAALYGKSAGAWLGFVFGFTVLVTDAAAFLAVSIPATIFVCLAKGILAGFAAGAVYKAVEKKNVTLGVALAAVVAPVVNTGVFLIGCALFFLDTVKGWGEALGFGSNVVAYMIFGLVGANFIVELAINVILSPAIVRLIDVGKKSVGAKAAN